ncbi:hypothetical protein LHT10_02060 [Lactococcus lactis]|uniref:hypothetical protein n=1 Tax=Lactococcus TaxID=1357 RepID=UPI001964E2DD|nr:MULTISPECIES: hypothetical protein [Lactococcus]MCG0999936.1 hypothetical protein [Lactococcus lactis]QRZ10209.1 hypothetical protein JVB21_05150 [Lactococcus taiwanensis]
MEKYIITAVSQKKDPSWAKGFALGEQNWGDFGLHFDRKKFGTILDVPGVYLMNIANHQKFGESNPKWELDEVKKVASFEDLIALAESK